MSDTGWPKKVLPNNDPAIKAVVDKMTPQPNTIQEILDKVSLNSSKGYTKIGLERAIKDYITTCQNQLLDKLRGEVQTYYEYDEETQSDEMREAVPVQAIEAQRAKLGVDHD